MGIFAARTLGRAMVITMAVGTVVAGGAGVAAFAGVLPDTIQEQAHAIAGAPSVKEIHAVPKVELQRQIKSVQAESPPSATSGESSDALAKTAITLAPPWEAPTQFVSPVQVPVTASPEEESSNAVPVTNPGHDKGAPVTPGNGVGSSQQAGQHDAAQSKHVPPGQAKKSDPPQKQVPPGQVEKSDPPPAVKVPPGQAKKDPSRSGSQIRILPPKYEHFQRSRPPISRTGP